VNLVLLKVVTALASRVQRALEDAMSTTGGLVHNRTVDGLLVVMTTFLVVLSMESEIYYPQLKLEFRTQTHWIASRSFVLYPMSGLPALV